MGGPLKKLHNEAYQMLLALNYIHSIGVVHRDIKRLGSWAGEKGSSRAFGPTMQNILSLLFGFLLFWVDFNRVCVVSPCFWVCFNALKPAKEDLFESRQKPLPFCLSAQARELFV